MENAVFERLYLACRSAITRYVYYRLPSKDDGDDVLQDVLLTAYLKRDEIKNPDNFKFWLLKIARNKCNDFYRNLAKRNEIPLDDTVHFVVSRSRSGITFKRSVRQTISNLADKDKQMLYLYYFEKKSQSEIAEMLNIPVGTVKSRLYMAKQNFKKEYEARSGDFQSPIDITNNNQGVRTMRELKEIMSEYKITPSKEKPFEVRCEEILGWFIIPKLGEKITWASYDNPERKKTFSTKMEVIGKAVIHGVEGVEIFEVETDHSRNVQSERRFITQLTDTHCRFLAESYVEDGVRQNFTFLDGDEFLSKWGFGEENAGNEVNLKQTGVITKEGDKIACVPFRIVSILTDEINSVEGFNVKDFMRKFKQGKDKDDNKLIFEYYATKAPNISKTFIEKLIIKVLGGVQKGLRFFGVKPDFIQMTFKDDDGNVVYNAEDKDIDEIIKDIKENEAIQTLLKTAEDDGKKKGLDVPTKFLTNLQESKTFQTNRRINDVIGRYDVEINGKKYDTVCLVGIEMNGILTEQYIDQNGRTVLWRRFNKDNWQTEQYKELWSVRLPDSERLVVNGEVYVHWYDCVSDYLG
jgi:RNA polymerase sigma factor (sigma-70 family)